MAKAAIVTGGSSGIGYAIARMLHDEAFALTIAARNPERLETAAAELGAHAVPTDVSRDEDCERVIAEHRERFERVDVLVNCAGVGVAARIEDLQTKHWDLQFAVNLRGAFLVTRFALPLLKQSRGLVVNVSSIAGTVAAPGLAAYGAAKAGLISLTRSTNAEAAADFVRAVAICPGFVDT